jgi:hypothetical protein
VVAIVEIDGQGFYREMEIRNSARQHNAVPVLFSADDGLKRVSSEKRRKTSGSGPVDVDRQESANGGEEELEKVSSQVVVFSREAGVGLGRLLSGTIPAVFVGYLAVGIGSHVTFTY